MATESFFDLAAKPLLTDESVAFTQVRAALRVRSCSCLTSACVCVCVCPSYVQYAGKVVLVLNTASH